MLEKESTQTNAANERWKNLGSEAFKSYDKSRKIFRDLNALIVQDTFGAYASPKDERIFEIGAGDGELARLVSPDIKRRLISSDLNPKFAKMIQGKNRDLSVLSADAEKLPLRDGEIDIVSGYSTFDILPNMEIAAREIGRVLKENGKFIHFMDLQHTEYFVNDILGSDKRVFPNLSRFESQNEGGPQYHLFHSYAKVEDIRSVLEKIKGNYELYDLVNYYLEEPAAAYREMNTSGLEIMARALKKRGVNFTPLDYPMLFQERVGEIFSGIGFEILKNEMELREKTLNSDQILPPDMKGFNCVRRRAGMNIFINGPDIEPGKLKLISELHVFVAEKK